MSRLVVPRSDAWRCWCKMVEINERDKLENTPLRGSNPYQSPASSQILLKKKAPRWIHRAFLLNGILAAIPLLSPLLLNISINLWTAWEATTQQADPVIYQHFFWFSASRWAVLIYFLVPNLILAGQFIFWKTRSTQEK